MSIFDQDIQHPLEDLFDQIEEIINDAISREFFQRNAGYGIIEKDICWNLKKKNLFVGDLAHPEEQIHKISRVYIDKRFFLNKNPIYDVYLYWCEWADDGYPDDVYYPLFVIFHISDDKIIDCEFPKQ